MFISIVVSVVCEVGKGWANLATANSSWFSLYKPTVVTYGEKYELVAKLYTVPSVEPDMTASKKYSNCYLLLTKRFAQHGTAIKVCQALFQKPKALAWKEREKKTLCTLPGSNPSQPACFAISRTIQLNRSLFYFILFGGDLQETSIVISKKAPSMRNMKLLINL